MPSVDELLERCLLAIEPLVPLDDPAGVVDHVPTDAGEDAALLLAELVKLDMAAAIEGGRSPRVEEYLARAEPWMTAESAPFDLVLEEYQLRHDAGEAPGKEEFAQRFPQHAEMLAQFSRHAQTVVVQPEPRHDPTAGLEPGEAIDDFSVVQTLGSGAFATVYLARQESMQRLVALKVSAGTGDEPQALAQFDHPNIVRVFDQRTVGEADSTHLLYMQYLPGGTLSDVVKRVRWTPRDGRDGSLLIEAVDDNLLAAAQQRPEGSSLRAWLTAAPWPVSVAWVGLQLANALDEAHRRGVLHRDVKPANVLLSAEGVPKLADFNVSDAGAITGADAEQSLGGSIGYMAPEHLHAISGRPGTSPTDVAERADLFSLAVLLWELWQGQRPFRTYGKPESWSDAVAQQAAARNEDLLDPERGDDGSERVLESVLRQTLARSPDNRPHTGAELAGRLRLAMHPDAAELFDPPEKSWRRRLASVPTVIAAAAAILGPNIAAGVFNFFYNQREIIEGHADIPRMEPAFHTLANTVNGIAFPLGAVLIVWFARPVAQAIGRARRGTGPDPVDLDRLFALPWRAAWIGGALWGVASIVYPTVLSAWFPAFRESAPHFCASLLVCGGVAAVYPYFALQTWAVAVAYPRMVRPSMADAAFARRGESLRRDGAGFLLAAAAIPLLAIALLISRETPAVDAIRVAIVATACGVFVAFGVYRYVLRCWERMAPVLSDRPQRRSSDLGEA